MEVTELETNSLGLIEYNKSEVHAGQQSKINLFYCTTKPYATVCFCVIRSQRDHKRRLHSGRAHASPLITITLKLICDSLALPSPRQ